MCTGTRCFRDLRHSSKRCITTKNDGTNSTARQVDAIMPLSTARPSETRALAPAPVAVTKRHDAEDEGERGHQDRSEARPCRVNRRLSDRHIIQYPPLARDLHDQDRVLRRQRDQQHEPDLGVKIVGQAQAGQRSEGSQQRQRHREDHRYRRDPALVLAGEAQIYQQHAQAEHIEDLVADDLLLIGHRRPLVPGAARQGLVGDLLHQAHGLAGAEARRRPADDARRRIQVVEADQRRPDHRTYLHQRAQRHHLVVLASHIEILDVVRQQPVFRVRLHVNLERAAELVELIDVARPDIAGERIEYVADRNMQRLCLHPIDRHAKLRNRGAERGIQPLQPGLGVPVMHYRPGERLQLGIVKASVAQFDLHGEAAGIADALDRRRHQHHRHRVLQLVERALKIGVDRTQIGTAAGLAQTPILQDHVGDAGIRQGCTVVQHRDAADRNHLIHARYTQRDLGHLIHHLLRATRGRTIRKLRRDQHVALILHGNERRRQTGDAPDTDPGDNKGDDDHQAAVTRHGADQPCIPILDWLIDPIEAAKEEVALLRRDRHAQPQRALRRLQRCRVDRADQRGRRDHQGELGVHLPGQSRQERSRYEHRHQHQRDADDRPEQLVHRLDGGIVRGQATLYMVRRTLHDHDRVIDHDADRQNDRK